MGLACSRAASLLVLAVLSGPVGIRAQEPGPEDLSPHSEIGLIVDPASVRAGATFTVAVRVALDAGWHTYWVNGGDAGLPLALAWDLPAGFVAGDIEWPAPKMIPVAPLMSYGYEDELVVLAEIAAPERLPAGPLPIRATADWLVCADVCLPAMGEAAATLRSDAGSDVSADAAAVIEAARARMPQAADGWRTRAWAVEDGYVLELEPPSGADVPAPYLFVDEIGVVEHAAPQRILHENGAVRMHVVRSPFADAPAATLRGVMAADAAVDHGQAWAVEFTVEPQDDEAVAALADLSGADARWTGGVGPALDALQAEGAGSAGAASSLWLALLLALGGGVLLNLMPCVFPVLAVKVLGFVRQGGADPRHARGHALAFAGGVILSLWALAGVLMALRATGQSLGWGFQLQSPTVVAVLALLLFALGLNLSGVFELGLGMTRLGAVGDGDSYRDSFLTGGLAVVVATPCTAPFMGAALGYALVQPPLAGLAVFTGLGIGLATPYVVLASAPKLLRKLPAPGEWMVGLKEALAFPLYLSAVWLVWVFARQAGVDATAVLLVAMTLVGLAAWSVGRATVVERRWRPLPVAAGALALLAALGAARLGVPQSQVEGAGTLAWEKFAPERVAALRAEGRPVFIDFTAAWCLTCQVNERVAFSSEAVRRALAEADVALLQADWTNRDPVIADALAAFGRSGVPLYVLYPGDLEGKPALLPALLTPGIIVEAVEQLDVERRASAG